MKKIPVQQLADALHLSRVTVWKVLNDRPGVAPDTVQRVREAVERLAQAMELPGGVYNFGSENDCDMVTTARRACALLDIHPVIETADWPRSLLMDGGRLRAAAGVGFDDTLTGVQRCLRDYGLLK